MTVFFGSQVGFGPTRAFVQLQCFWSPRTEFFFFFGNETRDEKEKREGGMLELRAAYAFPWGILDLAAASLGSPVRTGNRDVSFFSCDPPATS